MISYKIHLIRTGSTSANPWKRYVGQSDLPLCGKGREALEELRAEFNYPKVEMVYSSPLSRCLQTADILYPDVRAVVIDDLKDMNLGEFEGKTFEELRGDAAFAAWLENSFENSPPGGEQMAAFTSRIVGALDGVLRRMIDERITSAAVFTHGGVIMSLLAAVGLPRLPLHQWTVANGTGYTLLMNTKLWMTDQAAEVFSFIPDQTMQDDMEVYGLYFNGP